MAKFFKKKEKKLGVATEKRRYDLPLSRAEGTDFMILLIALMSFLALMALAASFALSAMTERWSSGLENKMTIEIPAQERKGAALPEKEKPDLYVEKVTALLEKDKLVKNFEVLSDSEIAGLVSPWLGEDIALTEIPLPTLISVDLYDVTEASLKNLEQQAHAIAENIKFDRHESWLEDLLRFTGSLQLAAFLISLIIGVTTITAIAGAVRARMALYKAEVELLHLMGASDEYITRQFQRHACILAFQGAVLGTLCGALALLIIKVVAGDMGASLIPDFRLTAFHVGCIAALPLIAAIIGMMTARVTVLRALAVMP